MSTTATPPKWRYTAQRHFFTHDDDPESWDFRATTRPDLGLISRSYPTDAEFDPDHGHTQWVRFAHYVGTLNAANPQKQRYKMLYVIRHGEGIHNVKEKEVGREEWNRHWSRLSGDGSTIWEDAALTTHGEQQAKMIMDVFSMSEIRLPERIYSSPLRRCLRTTELAFRSILSTTPHSIKENLRERLGVHTCDKRSTKSFISSTFPSFTVAPDFTEEDELWKVDIRESLDEHIERSKVLLDEVFEEDGGDFVSLTAHSGALMALFGATGWGQVPVAAGAVYPLLVLAERNED